MYIASRIWEISVQGGSSVKKSAAMKSVFRVQLNLIDQTPLYRSMNHIKFLNIGRESLTQQHIQLQLEKYQLPSIKA